MKTVLTAFLCLILLTFLSGLFSATSVGAVDCSQNCGSGTGFCGCSTQPLVTCSDNECTQNCVTSCPTTNNCGTQPDPNAYCGQFGASCQPSTSTRQFFATKVTCNTSTGNCESTCPYFSCTVDTAAPTGSTTGTATAKATGTALDGYDRIDWSVNDQNGGTTTPSNGNGSVSLINLASNTNYTVKAVYWTSTDQLTQRPAVSCSGSPTFLTYPAAIPISTMSASCPPPGTTGTLSWTSGTGAAFDNLRIDNQANGWSGNCSSLNSGDLCFNPGSPGNFSSIAGATYGWWVDSCNSSGGCTSQTGPNFICTAPVVKPTVTCSPQTSTINSGQTVTWTATPSGGSSTYTSYTWSNDAAGLGTNCSGTSCIVSKSFTNTGTTDITKTATVTVTDNAGQTSNPNSCTVTVKPAPTPTVTLAANPTSGVTPVSPTLTWVIGNTPVSCTTTNSGTATMTGTWSGDLSSSDRTNGTHTRSTITLTNSSTSNQTRTFNISCTNPGGTNSDSVIVTVQSAGSIALNTAPACSGTASQIGLSWNTITGGSPYSVFRNSASYITGLTAGAYTDTGVTPSTQYSYYIDPTAGNNSNTVTRTAPVCVAPTVTPHACISSPIGAGDNSITIGWNTTDNPGVNWVDISPNSSFSTYYHKLVSGTSTTGPGGFNNASDGTALTMSSGTPYFIRTYNSTSLQHSPAYDNYTIPACAPPGTAPDLIVDSLSPVSANVNDPVTFSGRVVNKGNASAGASSARLRYASFAGGALDTTANQPTGTLNPNGPAAAASIQTVTWTWTASGVGNHTFEICANTPASTSFTESNPNNNCTFETITVHPAGTPFAPTVSATPSCIDATHSGSDVTIGYGSRTPPVAWVDISSASNFNSYYHKDVTSTTSTTAPNGFYLNPSNPPQELTLDPAPAAYYVRVSDNFQNSGAVKFSIPSCPSFCIPEADSTFCIRLGKTCGPVTEPDNCSTTRTVVSCGSCTNPETCGGSGFPGVCGEPRRSGPKPWIQIRGDVHSNTGIK